MYIGTNPTALRSQQWIVEATFELLHQKKYEMISIKNICEKADLSRQTFYQIFDSKESVIRYGIQQHFLTLKPMPESHDFHDLASHFARHIALNRNFIKLLHDQNLGYLLAKELSNALTDVANRFHPDREEKTRQLANSFLTAGLSEILLTWSQSDTISEQELISLLYQIVTGKYYIFQ